MSELTELERQYYASQREIAFIRQALGIGESGDIFKAIDDLAERSELERAVVEAVMAWRRAYDRWFPVQFTSMEAANVLGAMEQALLDATSNLRAARAAQGRTA